MATFKVNDKVRIVGATKFHQHIGKEGVITHELWIDPNSAQSAKGRLVYGVEIIGHPHPIFGDWSALPEHLAPLTDPKADEFIESLKKLGREPLTERSPINTGPAIHV